MGGVGCAVLPADVDEECGGGVAGGRHDFLRHDPRVAPAGEAGQHLGREIYGLRKDEGARSGDVDVHPQVLESGVGGYASYRGEEGGC